MTNKTQQDSPTKIPAKELREYLKLPVDHDLSRGTGGEVRVLPDGRVLWKLVAVRLARMWPSREAFIEWWRVANEEAAKGPVDMTLTLLPPVADFIRDVEAHAKSLGPRIGVADEALDLTPESLDAIDKALKKIPWAKRQVPDLVTPLVAYVGEVMRKGSGGRWTASSKSPGHENEPFVVGSDGRRCQPYAVVFLPMVEPSRRIPLRSAVDIQLRVGPPPSP
jgi:hypothetical protein